MEELLLPLKHIWIKNKYVNAILPFDKKYSYIILDEISEIIAESIIKNKSINEIIDEIYMKYDVNKIKIKNDLEEIIILFKKAGFLKDNFPENVALLENKIGKDTQYMINEFYWKNNIPFKVFLELTHKCNLRCHHCYLDDYSNTFISYSDITKIMDQLFEEGVVELFITGGEVGLHPDLEKILEYASKKFAVTLLTNGTLFDEKIIKKISSYPVYEVQISIYGLEEEHDNFVGKYGAWKRSINSLRLFKKYMGIGKAAIVANNMTYKSIDGLIKLLENEKIDYFITPIINSSTTGDSRTHNYRLTYTELENLFKNYNIKIGGNICTAGISRFRILPNKKVVPCELLEEIDFGNINELSFKEILLSERRINWIEFYKKWQGDKECIVCNKKTYCTNCIGTNFIENRDYNKKSTYACSIAKIQYNCKEVKKNDKGELFN